MKKASIPLTPQTIIIILILIAIVYFSFKNTGSLTQACEYGHWSVISYDMVKGEIKISGNVDGVNFGGCLDAYSVRNPEGAALGIYNKEDCEYIYGVNSWREDLGKCQLVNENWLQGKTVTYYGTCANTCYDSRGCGGLFGTSAPYNFSGGFDGTTFGFGGTDQAWLKKSCTGGAIVHFTPSAKYAAPISTPTIPTVPVTPTTPTPPTTNYNPNIFDKINNFIQSIFDWITGLFK